MTGKKFIDFFKLDKRKVLIFNIFVLIFGLDILFPCGFQYCPTWARVISNALGVMNLINLPVTSLFKSSQELLYDFIISYYSSNMDTANALSYKIGLVGGLIALLVYWTILSNLMIFGWDKVKKNR